MFDTARSLNNNCYLAVKIDVVSSRRSKDRATLQERLFTAATRTNDTYGTTIASRFVVTHGDEIQGLFFLQGAHDLLNCLAGWLDALLPHDLRFGVGVGSLNTPLQPQAIGMDGQAWHLAKKAIDTAHRQRSSFAILGLTSEQNHVLTAFANLLLAVRRRWTDKQRQAITLVQTSENQQAAAQKMGITPATFSKHLSTADWHEYARGHTAFSRLLTAFLGFPADGPLQSN